MDQEEIAVKGILRCVVSPEAPDYQKGSAFCMSPAHRVCYRLTEIRVWDMKSIPNRLLETSLYAGMQALSARTHHAMAGPVSGQFSRYSVICEQCPTVSAVEAGPFRTQ